MYTEHAASNGALANLAKTIVGSAEEHRATMRLFGGIGFWVHSPVGRTIAGLERPIDLDLDFVGNCNERHLISGLLRDMGFFDHRLTSYNLGQAHLRFSGQYRELPDVTIDVYLGSLWFNHYIGIRGRLIKDSPTVPLAELLLSKLQIVHSTGKDYTDLAMLLLEHEWGDNDRDCVNRHVVLRRLCRSWGMWYTAMRNLEGTARYCSNILSGNELAALEGKVRLIQGQAQSSPKTLAWGMRSLLGTRLRWYSPMSGETNQAPDYASGDHAVPVEGGI